VNGRTRLKAFFNHAFGFFYVLCGVDEQTINDIEYILDSVREVSYPHDELSLLRISLRRYLQGETAEESVAWAAGKLSETITFYNDPNR
jgi:hypothetical protein